VTPRRPVAALAVAAALAACSPSAPVAVPAPAPAGIASPTPTPSPTAAALPPVQDATGLTADGLVLGRRALPPERIDASRTFLLGQARRVAPGERPGLLLVLPAANTTLREEYDRYRLDDLRDHGLSVAVVATYGGSWNAGDCCGQPRAERIDDVAAVTAVRDDALRRTGGDPARVALLGHSVGGIMAWRLACEPTFAAAAVVAVSGTLTHPCPQRLARVPDLLALHGEQDASVPLNGSDAVVPLLGIAPPPVPRSAARLARAAGCDAPRRTGDSTSWAGCAGGGSVTLTVLNGRGHAWKDLDATRVAAQFLRAVLPGVR
jgi:polyhydroxybutyrate depolymerase